MMFGAGGGGVQGAETTQVSIPNNVRNGIWAIEWSSDR